MSAGSDRIAIESQPVRVRFCSLAGKSLLARGLQRTPDGLCTPARVFKTVASVKRSQRLSIRIFEGLMERGAATPDAGSWASIVWKAPAVVGKSVGLA